MRAIILDGNQRSALAATRSLGQKGIEVTIGVESIPSLCSRSRYCAHVFSYPSPSSNPDGFIQSLGEHLEGAREAVLFPMTDITMGEVLRNRERLGAHITIPFAGFESYDAASDKVNVFRTAKELDIPIPATLFSSDYRDTDEILTDAARLGYPVVLKPARSRYRLGNGWLQTGVRYAHSIEALRQLLANEPFRSFPFLVQERVVGPGVGVFLLIHQGEVVARFAHKRIREKPPSGGVSVVCESAPLPESAYRSAVKLLQAFDWTGVAMVELKWDQRDMTAKLMEINARFWGSLQLAIAAGVDFPWLLFRLACGDAVEPVAAYRVGLRSRWELGDFDHLLIRTLKRNRELSLPPDAPPKWKVVSEFLANFLSPRIRHEILRPEDLGPFLHEVGRYVRSAIGVR